MDYIRDFQMDGGKGDRFTLLGALVASISWFVPISCSQDIYRRHWLAMLIAVCWDLLLLIDLTSSCFRILLGMYMLP